VGKGQTLIMSIHWRQESSPLASFLIVAFVEVVASIVDDGGLGLKHSFKDFQDLDCDVIMINL